MAHLYLIDGDGGATVLGLTSCEPIHFLTTINASRLRELVKRRAVCNYKRGQWIEDDYSRKVKDQVCKHYPTVESALEISHPYTDDVYIYRGCGTWTHLWQDINGEWAPKEQDGDIIYSPKLAKHTWKLPKVELK